MEADMLIRLRMGSYVYGYHGKLKFTFKSGYITFHFNRKSDWQQVPRIYNIKKIEELHTVYLKKMTHQYFLTLSTKS